MEKEMSLVKRIEELEQKVSHLQEDITQCIMELRSHIHQKHIHNASKFHFIEAVKEFPNEIAQQNAFEDILNTLFRNRKEFHPCFAMWKVSLDEEAGGLYVVSVLLTTCHPISTLEFERLLFHHSMSVDYQSVDYGAFRELESKRFRTCGLWYYDIKNLRNIYTGQCIEDKGLSLDTWSSEMTDEPFTHSCNFHRDYAIQEFLDEYIHDNDISALLHI